VQSTLPIAVTLDVTADIFSLFDVILTVHRR